MSARPRRNIRPRDALGRPLPYGSDGVEPVAEGVVRTPQETLREAGRLLGEGRPFGAHEVFEDAWKSGPPDERDLWQGLAQVAVGITHAARGNLAGAARLIERGVDRFGRYRAASPYGLDVAALEQWAASARAELARASRAGPPDDPAVVLPAPPLAST